MSFVLRSSTALCLDLEHFLWYLGIWVMCIIFPYDHISSSLLVCKFLSNMDLVSFIVVSSTGSSLTHRSFSKYFLRTTQFPENVDAYVPLPKQEKQFDPKSWCGRIVGRWRARVTHPSVVFQERLCPGPTLRNFRYLGASPF